MTDPTGLYRVRLGFFPGDVPDPFIELLLNNQNEGIVSEGDANDKNTVFYTIPYTSQAEAEKKRQDLIAKGFKDATLEKMSGSTGTSVPVDPDDIGTAITPEPGEVFYKEGVYYRILVGKYATEVPGEYATIILQTENLLETEVDPVKTPSTGSAVDEPSYTYR